MALTITTPKPPVLPVVFIPAARTLRGVSCAGQCGARLTVDDANPTLGCDDDGDVYCGDCLIEHIAGCTVCGLEAHNARDES